MLDSKAFSRKVRFVLLQLNGPGTQSESHELEIWALRAHANRVGRNPLALFVWILNQPRPKRRGLATSADEEQGSRDRKQAVSRRSKYRRFLDSREWWLIRRRRIREGKYRCAHCGERRPARDLDVHHKNYKLPWGRERLEDLEVLCTTCHGSRHGRLKHSARGWSWVGECVEEFWLGMEKP